MTEPIKNKFDALEDGLISRHNALMDKIDDLLTDIVSPPDYTAAFVALGDKLDDVNGNLSSIGSGLTDMAENVLTTTNNVDGIYQSLVDSNGRLIGIQTAVDLIQQTMGIHTGGAEFTLASLVRAQLTALNSLYTRLAGIASPWPADVLAAIQCVCEATSSLIPIDPLDETKQPPTCVAHYVSSGFNLFPAVPPITSSAIIYATWSEPLPDGLEYGTSLLGDLSDGILTTTDWSTWSVFVKSDEPQYADDPLQPERYPTNQWRTMTGSGARVFSVSERGSIEVHFCKLDPFALAEGDCMNVSDNLTVSGHRAWLIPESLPDSYVISSTDNWYMYTAELDYVGGPYMAGNGYPVSTLRADGGQLMRLGAGPGDPVQTITICNPEPL